MTLRIRRVLAVLALLVLAVPFASGQARAAYSQAELDQMLAPIALYPDPLLSQILMAATRPEEVADAARWSADHRGVEGDAAVQMVEPYDWDPSVKSLVAFPNVLERMGQSPDWTRRLGEAFIVQEPLVMDTVQGLRRRAQASGNLASDDYVRVIEEPQSIAIVPAQPQVVYVPYYDPLVVYGSWWWPSYPPFYWDPWPAYYAYRPYYRSAFWWGPPIGISAGFFFGAIDWPRRYVRIARTDNYYVRPWIERRQFSATPGRWRHDFWQRRDFASRGTVTQSQTFAPNQTQQFAAPGSVTQHQAPSGRTQRQFAAPTTQQQYAAPTTQQPRRFEEQRRWQTDRRAEGRGQPEFRRPDTRPGPSAAAASVQQAAPARVERAPAPHVERGGAPRMERAAPQARMHQAPPAAARAERSGPPAHSNGNGRSREHGR